MSTFQPSPASGGVVTLVGGGGVWTEQEMHLYRQATVEDFFGLKSVLELQNMIPSLYIQHEGRSKTWYSVFQDFSENAHHLPCSEGRYPGQRNPGDSDLVVLRWN